MSTETHTIWYRISPVHGGLVFALPADASYANSIFLALQATTWGQLRMQLSLDDFLDVVMLARHCRSNNSSTPSDDEELNKNEIAEYCQNGYPKWASISIEAVLPFHITIKYGRRCYPGSLDDYLFIHPMHEQSILTELINLKYYVHRRDDIMFW